MKKGASFTLSATTLRIGLSATLLVIAAIGIVAFGLMYGQLRSYAGEVSVANAKARSTDSTVQALQLIQRKLSEEQPTVQKAKKIVADSKQYQYQDEIIRDLTTYAQRAGVNVTDFSFSEGSGASSSSGTSSTPSSSNAPAISGVKSTSVNITLKDPVNYVGLLRFINFIENNLSRMQLTSLNVTGSNGENSQRDDVGTGPLALRVFIR